MRRLLAMTARAVVVGIAVLLWTAMAAGADYVWIEGESPTSKNCDAVTSGSGLKSDYLSEKRWLSVQVAADKVAAAVPQGGIQIGYDFQAPSAGKYEVWNRIGYEFTRSAFDWRIDAGEWRTVQPTDHTTDLMELQEWCGLGWLKMGDADLIAGKHTIEIQVKPAFTEDKDKKQVPANLTYCSDVICLSKTPFRPNSHFKPDEEWRTDQDRKAAEQIFEVKASTDPSERVETPLSGTWQAGRYDEDVVEGRDGPTTTLPAPDQVFWRAIAVPGNKFKVAPELAFCHRFVYRTRIDVPAEMAGKSFFLRFPSIDMIASLYVNGQYCGWTKAMFALWECDVTKAIKPGQTNEVCLIIKDAYYAIAEKKNDGKSCRESFNIPSTWMADKNFIYQHFDFPVGTSLYATQAGILEPPSFVATGGVYANDVFCKPSVANKKLGLEITLFNSGAADRKVQVVTEVVPAAARTAQGASGGLGARDSGARAVEGGAAEKTFAAKEVTVAAGKEEVLKVEEPWDNAKLWWPDSPALYQAVTKVMADGKTLDISRRTFGFREWDWSGPQFKLNGVPWQMWGDSTNYAEGKKGLEGAQAQLDGWRKSDQNMMRFWGRDFCGLGFEEGISFLDEAGVPVRLSGIFDGMGANYLHGLNDNKEMFDNWIVQLTAQIRQLRNHPSIFIWSIENEITFINVRNLGMSKAVEPEIERAAKAAMAVDPTRPAMVDGGNCLMNNSLPVNGVHYEESFWRDYPDEAYSLAQAIASYEKPTLPGFGKSSWQLVLDRPIFMGESWFLRGSKPGEFALFGGEGCFSGWGDATRRGAGVYAKMLSEGYRWWGVAAYQFSASSFETGNIQCNSWRPVSLFCREWNWTFGGGSKIDRTLKVFNDTRYSDPIEAAWELTLDGKHVAGEKKTFNLAPGVHEEYTVSVAVPQVAKRTAGEFVLTCSRKGQEVFREVKPVAVIDPADGPKTSVAKKDLVVLDPSGEVKARLVAREIAFTEAASLDAIPADAKVVVVGKDALTPREATDPRWVNMAAAGAKILVLDQASPLRYLALPADLAPTQNVGRIAFSEDLTHPIFDGLDQPDFFTWSGDHVVYRNVYTKATRGARSLAHCDEQLGCSAIAECPINEGLILLCQMAVGTKLGTEPVAQRLFDNMLAYTAAYKPVHKTTAAVLADVSPAIKILADSGLKFDKVADVMTAISDGKHDIVVFDASAANLQALAAALPKVQAFTEKGGWLMALGVGPEGLADFNKIVGVQHILRPFELERVTMPEVRDPLMSGITARDVAMESNVQIFPWQADKYMADDEFTQVVDLDDIAPFCEFPNAKAGDNAAARKAEATWTRNIVNGFTSETSWKLIYYMNAANPKIALTLPRQEEIASFSIVPNVHYQKAKKVNLYFDGDTTPVALTIKPLAERQDFPLAPRKASALTIELADFEGAPSPTTGIENIWIGVTRSDDWKKKVVPLLNVGGLVKYPMGQGGLVLNQLNLKETEAVPANAQKKAVIVTTLLGNLHATFAGGKVLSTTSLKFQPIPFNEQCNQYLTKDRGWFGGNRDIAHMPVGEVTLAGVAYVVRDFKTSPVASCIMLAGPSAKGQLPNEVTGLKAGCKADSLFFLHTMNRAGEWKPGNKPEEKVPPVLFKYVVHYADGKTEEVPVLYGEGAANWISPNPAGLKSAAVAWAAPFPGEDSPDQAVVYQMQWANPRPDAEIATIDVAYGPAGSKYGAPAVLAITAARETAKDAAK